MFDCFKKTLKSQGLKGLYQGNHIKQSIDFYNFHLIILLLLYF
jgi:hypothetical protein